MARNRGEDAGTPRRWLFARREDVGGILRARPAGVCLRDGSRSVEKGPGRRELAGFSHGEEAARTGKPRRLGGGSRLFPGRTIAGGWRRQWDGSPVRYRNLATAGSAARPRGRCHGAGVPLQRPIGLGQRRRDRAGLGHRGSSASLSVKPKPNATRIGKTSASLAGAEPGASRRATNPRFRDVRMPGWARSFSSSRKRLEKPSETCGSVFRQESPDNA